MTRRTECTCGSGLAPVAQYDGYNIFLCYTCPKCEREKMRGWRSDIRTRYQTDEQIESDD